MDKTEKLRRIYQKYKAETYGKKSIEEVQLTSNEEKIIQKIFAPRISEQEVNIGYNELFGEID